MTEDKRCERCGKYDCTENHENNDALTTIAAELKRLNRLVAYVIRRKIDYDDTTELNEIMREE